MEGNIWCFENFNFYEILCPYKLEDHVRKNPLNVYSRNDFLFMEEDSVNEIILIDNGKVKVGQYDEKGNETVIYFSGKGEILGQMALLGETRHRSFAEVMEDGTQVCKMSVQKAMQLTRDYVPFALEMNRRISGHVRKLERRIEILLFKSVRTRLMEFIKDLAKEYGRQRDNGIWISHALTQSDIATLIGTSRKSASLVLNEMEDEGMISFDRRHIFIHDPRQLNLPSNTIGVVSASNTSIDY